MSVRLQISLNICSINSKQSSLHSFSSFRSFKNHFRCPSLLGEIIKFFKNVKFVGIIDTTEPLLGITVKLLSPYVGREGLDQNTGCGLYANDTTEAILRIG